MNAAEARALANLECQEELLKTLDTIKSQALTGRLSCVFAYLKDGTVNSLIDMGYWVMDSDNERMKVYWGMERK